ncbi:hypothetical protein SADUNF_Sadunf12G0050100 [Salix dunnii]|uniref:RNase H type-1 domain-containing protein n=1 Tax=Salix dunnii TaxID=1413687 RepID=A0A835JIJ7_9ROSI|nr:hypothetical protein SADUNF_Sadunf12G0050100 [Salix dunnii]
MKEGQRKPSAPVTGCLIFSLARCSFLFLKWLQIKVCKMVLEALIQAVTLVESTISTFHLYTKQSAWLQSHFCKEVEEIASGFLWGSLDKGHGIHLVNSDAVTLPKYRRGLGLRMARDNNCNDGETICDNEQETQAHALYDCLWVKMIWQQFPLSTSFCFTLICLVRTGFVLVIQDSRWLIGFTVKINMDGSDSGALSHAEIGGTFPDDGSRWLIILEAVLAAAAGLQYRHILPLNIVSDIHYLCQEDWNVVILKRLQKFCIECMQLVTRTCNKV